MLNFRYTIPLNGPLANLGCAIITKAIP